MSDSKLLKTHQIDIRVRYKETDGQGRVHHGNYFTYFEMGRVEQLRASGWDYRRLEEEGTLMVVYDISCRYYLPAFYDDLLILTTMTTKTTHTRIYHEYEIHRGDERIVKANSVLACIDRAGRVRRMPEWVTPE